VIGGANSTMNGSVSGSVFGGSIAMVFEKDAAVGRNFYFGGFSLTTDEGSIVGKDLLSGTYQSILSGAIVRDLKVGAEAVELNGSIGGNAVIEVSGSSAQDIEETINPTLSRRWYASVRSDMMAPFVALIRSATAIDQDASTTNRIKFADLRTRTLRI